MTCKANVCMRIQRVHISNEQMQHLDTVRCSTSLLHNQSLESRQNFRFSSFPKIRSTVWSYATTDFHTSIALTLIALTCRYIFSVSYPVLIKFYIKSISHISSYGIELVSQIRDVSRYCMHSQFTPRINHRQFIKVFLYRLLKWPDNLHGLKLHV